jgi:hypothetical protein
MSGWDWLHAGLGVATYAKAQNAKRQLEEMKSAAEREAARRAMLDAMRDLIFDLSRDIQLAEEQLTEFPQQVYIVSKTLAWKLAESGLTPEVFPDFQDKEYVLATEKRIAQVIDDSRAPLSDRQVEQSERAIQYIVEMPLLQGAVSAVSARESLASTADQWKETRGRQRKKKNFRVLGFVGIGLTLCAGIWLILGGLSTLMSGAGLGGGTDGVRFGMMMGGMLMVGVGAAIPVGSVALLVLGERPNPTYEPLKTKRENWRRQLLPSQDWERVKSTFGDLNSAQFEQILEQRLAFLNPLLGGDFQKYLGA